MYNKLNVNRVTNTICFDVIIENEVNLYWRIALKLGYLYLL